MKFNDISFLFVFLPATVVLFYAIGLLGRPGLNRVFLVAASVAFYGFGRFHDLAVFTSVISLNYVAGYAVGAMRIDRRRRFAALAAAVTINTCILGYYKYATFFVANFGAAVPGIGPADVASIVLPIGISFYVFQQISYLVDHYRDPGIRHEFPIYSLFVSFFPHLIAGPIVRYAEIAEQFRAPGFTRPNYENLAVGMFLIALGLTKKLVFADTFALWVDPVFGPAEAAGFTNAWVAALAYTLQIYFDFSGYSDLAVGLALLFNIRFPFNFESPYKSLSVTEFWQRWHITLGRFLREYIYFPLGGSRCGLARTCGNLIIVFAIGGLWHGANWTFVIWGVLQGLALVVHRIWQRTAGRVLPPIAAWAITFVFTVLAWVPFRASGPDSAIRIWRAMLGFDLDDPGFALTIGGIHPLATMVIFSATYAVVLFAPNSRTLSDGFTPSIRHACAVGLMWCAILVVIGRNSPFIYFQF